MSKLWKKSSKQVYLHVISFRETDSYKDFSISFGLCLCGCKDKQNIWIWQVDTKSFPPRCKPVVVSKQVSVLGDCCSLLQLLQLVFQREKTG